MAHDNASENVRQPLLGAGQDQLVSYDGSQPAVTAPSSSPASSITAINSPKEVTVEFDPNGDPENPQDWPLAFKWSIVLLLSMLGFITYVSPLRYHTLTNSSVYLHDDFSHPPFHLNTKLQPHSHPNS